MEKQLKFKEIHKYFAKNVYCHALRIRPKSSRLNAHYNALTKAIKAEREKPGDDKAKNKATGCISPSINKAKREESGDDKGPYFWLRKFENWSFIDEEIHESTFHFLDKATAETITLVNTAISESSAIEKS